MLWKFLPLFLELFEVGFHLLLRLLLAQFVYLGKDDDEWHAILAHEVEEV